MENVRQVSPQITVGPQPTEADIAQLSAQGFKSVVNFRTASEKDQPLSPDAEAEKVQAAGMTYVHIPVPMGGVAPADAVDQFRRQYANLPKPIFAHCKGGKRAGAVVMMHLGVQQGMTGEQTLQQAAKLGFPCDQPELKEFVKTYVDGRAQS